FFFFSSRRRHTRFSRDWSSDVCSSDLPRLRAARCLITGVHWTTSVPQPVKGSRTIYRDYPLLRSLAVLEPYLAETAGQGQAIRLPDAIHLLVQAAYGSETVGPAEWQETLEKAAIADDAHQADQRGPR